MSNDTQNPQSEANQPRNFGEFTTQKALFQLYETAAPHLSQEQLGFLSQATEAAQDHAEKLAKVIKGLGVLIDADEINQKNKESSIGYFNGLTPLLLHTISEQLEFLAGLIVTGSCAEYQLNNPEKFNFKVE